MKDTWSRAALVDQLGPAHLQTVRELGGDHNRAPAKQKTQQNKLLLLSQ